MNSQLPEIVRILGVADDNRYAFVAAEFSVVKEIRQYLKEVKKMEREEFSAQAYRKLGATEAQSVAERRSS